jgi:hypothetical protein
MIARGTGYVRGSPAQADKRLDGHLHYLQYRPRASNESFASRSLFSRHADRVTSQDARELVEAHSCARVRFHKFFLSPAKGEPIPDPRAWLRTVMHDLEQRLGKELHWVAVYHANTTYPHVHVVLAGTGTNIATGREQMIKLSVADYAFLREAATKHSAAHWYRQLTAAGAAARGGLLTLPPLLPGELQTGTYRGLLDAGNKGDDLTPHHMPSAEFMKQFGVTRDQGVALMMEHPAVAGRHRETRTYGVSPNLGESPREALAHDIRDVRRIYRAAGVYNDATRDALREIIYLNKLWFPHLF